MLQSASLPPAAPMSRCTWYGVIEPNTSTTWAAVGFVPSGPGGRSSRRETAHAVVATSSTTVMPSAKASANGLGRRRGMAESLRQAAGRSLEARWRRGRYRLRGMALRRGRAPLGGAGFAGLAAALYLAAGMLATRPAPRPARRAHPAPAHPRHREPAPG